MNNSFEGYIDKELSLELKERIVHHRSRFRELFKARYNEMLPSLIKYRNSKSVSIDFMKLEVALRNGYDVVIGETLRRNIQVIGFATSQLTKNNPADLFSDKSLKSGDINFVIPKHLRMTEYKEITNDDECQTGNFVVLRNKNLNYVDDRIILDHYIDELAEIVLSRFSISMQVKISTVFISEANDESVTKMISDLYNGDPFIKATKLFDPEEQIYPMKNEGLSQIFPELKREYQNKISELNNMLGINSLAVEKESGVSDTEAESNRSFSTSNANIYLDARNNGLQRLNKRYGFNIEAMYNDEVVSEFEELHQTQESEDNNDNNNAI